MHNLKDIFELENLKKVWKVIHEGIYDDLIRDPLDYLAYETHIETNLKQLRYSVLNNNYNPRSVIILKSAKRDGLSRSLSFLEIEDLIVLKTICDYLQPYLHKDFPEYVDFSRTLRTAFPKDESDYEGWFEHWIKHQNKLTKIIARRNGWKYIVFADISNFFPSINHAILRQLISSRIDAEEKVINLLFYIIESMIPKPGYCCDHKQGLPQESHDASRILAHTFLYHLDNIFKIEGEEGRYARWVDDIVIAVDNEPIGRTILSKIQSEIESKGLFLNNSKCRIIEGDQAVRELWLEENEFLDAIHQDTEEHRGIDVDGFDEKLKSFLGQDRKENWSRILRRFYTESRRINSSYLEKFAFKHIIDFPSEAGAIFSYLEARPFSENIFQQTFEYLKSEWNCYQDIEITTYEFLMKWSIPNDETIRESCSSLALDHFFGRKGFMKPLIDYVRGLITLLCYKISGRPALEQISRFYKYNDDIQFLKYAFCCLAASEDFKDMAFEKVASIEDISIRRLEKLFRDLEKCSQDHLMFLERYFSPKVKINPHRVILPARVLPLIRICRRDKDFLNEWEKICRRTLKELESPENKSLNDHLSIDFIKSELRSA